MPTSILKVFSPKVLLILTCLFFLLTRLYKIDSIPPSLYWDEASFAYNAYAISQTGKDEWGEFLPIHFRAFGEFKLPVYIYTTAIFVKFFGLNEFSARLPAVFFSLLLIIVTYLLSKELFKDKQIALLSSFFLSISPWLFIFSRVAHEVSAGLTFFLLGIYLMILAAKKKYFIIIATFSFILCIYSYNSFRILVPLTFILLILMLYFHFKFKYKLFTSISVVIFLVSLTPIVRLLIYDAGFGRVQSFALLPTIQRVYDLEGKPHLQLIFDRSKSTNWGENFSNVAKNYFVHFSPNFLLFEGDSNSRNHPHGSGQLFFLDPLLILIGIYAIKRKGRLLYFLPIILMFLGPLPAILFKEAPHASRSLAVTPFASILMAVGANTLINRFRGISILILVIYLLFFAFFYQNYVTHYSKESSQDWQYGYKRLFTDYKDEFEKFDKIIVSDDYAQPYIFALYYLKYNPEKFRSEARYSPVNNWGFSTVESFGKFEFRRINKTDANARKTLIFATDTDKLEIEPSGQIKFLNGEIAFWIYNLN